MFTDQDVFYKTQALNEINITPLVDVTMVMLIIFILIAPVIEQGITIKLPSTSDKAMRYDNTVTVSISQDKKIYVGNSLVTLPDLEHRLKTMAEGIPELPVILRADKQLNYETVIKVLDTIHKAGINKVGLATKVERVK